MTEAEKLDRRIIRTRKAIMRAFDKLVVEGGIEKLTVSALAREANIDRKTFYLHYKSIDELVNRRAESSLDRITDALRQRGEGKSPTERVHIALEEVNTVLLDSLDLYSSVAASLSVDRAVERFYVVVKAALERSGVTVGDEDLEAVRMCTQFYIAGAFSLYATWLKSDHATPITTVSDTIELAMCSSAFPPISHENEAAASA